MPSKYVPHAKKHAKTIKSPNIERSMMVVAVVNPLMTLPQSKPIIVADSLWTCMELLVIIGILR